MYIELYSAIVLAVFMMLDYQNDIGIIYLQFDILSDLASSVSCVLHVYIIYICIHIVILLMVKQVSINLIFAKEKQNFGFIFVVSV